MEMEIADQIERHAEAMFGPQLAALGFDPGQIKTQDLDDLEESLQRLNDVIAQPDSFGTYRVKFDARFGLIIVKSSDEAHFTVGVLPLLLRRKKLILERIKTLRPQEQLVSVRRDVLENVSDGELKEQVLVLIDDHLAAERKRSEQLEQESKTLERTAEVQAAQRRLDVELKERRSVIYKSLLERETVAGVVGPILLLLLAVSLIIAMFTQTPTSAAVSNSFLLVLGYFFGQTTNRKDERPKEETPEQS